MMDVNERLRELEAENEMLLDLVRDIPQIEQERAIYQLALENIEVILNGTRSNWDVLKDEVDLTRRKLDVLGESK